MKKLTLFTILLASVFGLKATEGGQKATYKVDASKSNVQWVGYHLAKSYEHTGTVDIKSGSLEIDGDQLIGGSIVIDMTTITNQDLKDDAKDKAKLEKHLKSDDFFGVKKYPEASLAIKSSKVVEDHYEIIADLTIRGITKEVQFSATRIDSGNNVTFEASLSVERTAHQVMYGWKVENAILGGEFLLNIKLSASK